MSQQENMTHKHHDNPKRMNDAEIMVILSYYIKENSDVSSIITKNTFTNICAIHSTTL